MTISLANAANISDLAKIARRRLPDCVLAYLDGGAQSDRGVARNEAAFERILFHVRRLNGGPLAADTATTLFGKPYSQPFGIAPVGLANLMWPGTDLILAKLAQRERIPYTISTAGSTPMEKLAEAAGDMTWFQLYMSRKDAITDDLMKRAWDAGIRVLALTVDVPGMGRRNRHMRDGVDLPFKMSSRVALDLMRHPAWSWATFLAGPPAVANYGPYANSSDFQVIGQYMAELSKHDLYWDDLRRVRDNWKGQLLVKGVLEPEDAVEMVRTGVDGMWISNHGGRQLEGSPATIDAVAGIRDAVGPSVGVIVDSGIRNGEDIVKARALGADMVFTGRSFMFGTGAGGAAGAEKAFRILSEELRIALAQAGCPVLASVGRDMVYYDRSGPIPPREAERRYATNLEVVAGSQA